MPITVLAILLIIASFYDLQISKTLADLEFGQYYSHNFFARFFEVIGEMPVYFLISFSFCIFSISIYNNLKLQKIKEKTQKKQKTLNFLIFLKIFGGILFVAIAFVFFYIGFNKMLKYIYRLNSINNNYLTILLPIIFSLILDFFVLVLLSKVDNKKIEKLCYFGFIIICSALITNIVVQSLKPLFARMRYRAMTFLNDATFSGFTPWFNINGEIILTDFQKSLGLSKDIFKSFPSGHTAAATSILALCSIPFLFEDIKRYKKILLFVLPFVYVVVVALSRIVMGAHFLSDTLVSFVVGYVCVLAFTIVFVKYFNKRKFQSKSLSTDNKQ